MTPKKREFTIIGAGLIGSALAYRLAERGHAVRVLDPCPPGRGGASYGNVGHIAAELVEPLPSPRLLMTFWKELVQFGGPLHMPVRHWPRLFPWSMRFVAAAFRRRRHTALLAPMVRGATGDFRELLASVGRLDLLRENGHQQLWFGPDAERLAHAEASHMASLDIPTIPSDSAWLAEQARHAGAYMIAGLGFPTCGHVLDPAEVALACALAAQRAGATFDALEAIRIEADAQGATIHHGEGTSRTECVVVCSGVWSRQLLRGFGLNVPLQPAWGYHVELPGESPRTDAPILYCNQRLLVTPMTGRLRASSFMEFSGTDSRVDVRKFRRIDNLLASVGYPASNPDARWRGPRPILPDYLPGLGQVPSVPVHYAIGHQHIGLTLAPITAELMADHLTGVRPRIGLDAFDLRRFG